MTKDELYMMAEGAAHRHGLKFLGVLETSVNSDIPNAYECRMKHRTKNWYGAIIVEHDKPAAHVAAELDGLAEACAEGPSAEQPPEPGKPIDRSGADVR